MEQRMLFRIGAWLDERWERRSRRTPVRIRTERLLLREFELSDWAAVHCYRSDPEVRRYLGWTKPSTRRTVEWEILSGRMWMRLFPRIWTNLAIVLGDEERLFGESGLAQVRPDEAMLGFALHRDFWGCGYATEAARGMLRHGFEELKLTRISAGCLPENQSSRRVLEKLGMRPEGLKPKVLGSPRGALSLVFSIDRNEWMESAPGGV